MNSSIAEGENILDLLLFDITKYFETDYQIVHTEDSPAVQVVDYEQELPINEFNIFDTLHLMVMYDKFFITSDTHLNATFRTKKRELSIKEIKEATNFFFSLYGLDDSKKGKWTKSDVKSLKLFSFNRIWPIGNGESFVKLAYKKDTGFELSILFLNNLLESVGKKIYFN